MVSDVYSDGLPEGASIRLDIDRQKAEALGVSFINISDILSTAMGSSYINDFPNEGRMQQVIMQADASARMQVDDVLKLHVRNSRGDMVSLAEVVTPVWDETPLQMVRYLGYPATSISGSAAKGASTGDAMAEMERLAHQLPPGFAVAWTGQSFRSASPLLRHPCWWRYPSWRYFWCWPLFMRAGLFRCR
ncbi:hypothetical protein HORIV_12390 [Vreelandella olivaria]|uniref:Uncharacterized protein n=1 Tax=Vreelandella olivaria TaxID=390919 RepID=A0ABN5WPD9_9GAMM|nr:hypothetical protein HORIV_12390 [Halomonas olivaria]